MSLGPDQIRHLAKLARIAIDDRDAGTLADELGAILGIIDRLLAIDTTGVVPMAHAHDSVVALRDDAVTEGDQRELFQRAAPAVAGGLYLVPKVIE
ncbi:MAG: Asp-tRNA(Asn)/Glu-tRNA(Gln) amidotransferase subunit GatC [Proteobacteria bacterium]|jgi:aspartyl-tRNA(Asn)/glutamyl-tRNA(Gln) amidotransferase subunit C|nr:Asp-tRNA(Asn)/Glu-tRNA(Gln) amidotransferase subunit GatC [Pseudomonadota bacterium]